MVENNLPAIAHWAVPVPFHQKEEAGMSCMEAAMADNFGMSPDEVQFRFRDDEPVDHGTVTVDAALDQTNAYAVRIEPGDDARLVLRFLDRLALVEVNFPSFGDGRGYSAARILREAGYTGELRAVGDVGIDQLSHMRRCGFDSFAPDHPLDPADAARAFATWDNVYQRAPDARPTIAQLRHET